MSTKKKKLTNKPTTKASIYPTITQLKILSTKKKKKKLTNKQTTKASIYPTITQLKILSTKKKKKKQSTVETDLGAAPSNELQHSDNASMATPLWQQSL